MSEGALQPHTPLMLHFVVWRYRRDGVKFGEFVDSAYERESEAGARAEYLQDTHYPQATAHVIDERADSERANSLLTGLASGLEGDWS